MSLAHNVWCAEAAKKAVSIPVVASGSINLPALAESILEEGKGDFIGLGRPLWADPQWPLKAKEGPARGHQAVHPLQRRLPRSRRPYRQHGQVHRQRGPLPRSGVRDHPGDEAHAGGRGRRRTGRHGSGPGGFAQGPRRHPLREARTGRGPHRGRHPGVQGAGPRASEGVPQDPGAQDRRQGGRRGSHARRPHRRRPTTR